MVYYGYVITQEQIFLGWPLCILQVQFNCKGEMNKNHKLEKAYYSNLNNIALMFLPTVQYTLIYNIFIYSTPCLLLNKGQETNLTNV